jgi:hypothetical protein
VIANDALAGDWNLLRVRRLALAAARATTSDISSLGELYSLGKAIHDTPANRIVRLTVSAQDEVLYGADYLAASPEQLGSTVRAWLGASRPRASSSRRVATVGSPAPVQLAADGGRGQALLSTVATGMRTCAPTALPDGFWWPSSAARSYKLAGHPATALYATAGSGDAVLWMFTPWADPPVLRDPTTTVTRRGRSYDVFTAGGKIREIAWKVGATRVWITNTLRDTLTNPEMLALADSCR